ncbi:hypothetical protein Acr_00g0072220 [Actinidia rufa]|uniref:PGG domain-containing protein n=1 Tax=Actinidia rufa TaxID=165716 RepID=A0A7J0DT39_9ERIC|nr:hypothetical protein Acr_00g0072220 [Actinidia rufa]
MLLSLLWDNERNNVLHLAGYQARQHVLDLSSGAVLLMQRVYAAITVPGGSNGEDGLPIFSKEKVFIVFAILDALALLSSISEVLAALSIFTSWYAVMDFLYALLKRLINWPVSDILFSNKHDASL